MRGGCLLNDLHAPRGIDLNLFGDGLRACKPIIPIWFKNTTLCARWLNWLLSVLVLPLAYTSLKSATQIKTHTNLICMDMHREVRALHCVAECCHTNTHTEPVPVSCADLHSQSENRAESNLQMKECCLPRRDWLSWQNNDGCTLCSSFCLIIFIYFFYFFFYLIFWNEIWIGMSWKQRGKCLLTIPGMSWSCKRLCCCLLSPADGHTEWVRSIQLMQLMSSPPSDAKLKE